MVGNVYCFPCYFVFIHTRGNYKICFGNDNAFTDTVIFTNICHMIKEVVIIFKTNLQIAVVSL